MTSRSSTQHNGALKARQQENNESEDSLGPSTGSSGTRVSNQAAAGPVGNGRNTPAQSAQNPGSNAESLPDQHRTLTSSQPDTLDDSTTSDDSTGQRSNAQDTAVSDSVNANRPVAGNTNSRLGSTSPDTDSSAQGTEDNGSADTNGSGVEGSTSRLGSNTGSSVQDTEDNGSADTSSPGVGNTGSSLNSNTGSSAQTTPNSNTINANSPGVGETTPRLGSNIPDDTSAAGTVDDDTTSNSSATESEGHTGASTNNDDQSTTHRDGDTSSNTRPLSNSTTLTSTHNYGTAEDDSSTDSTETGENSAESADQGDDTSSTTDQDAPAYNLKNQTCEDILALPSREAWKATDGSRALQSFVDMYNQDLLVCDDCFGLKKDQCKSKSAACKDGIRTKSIPENGDNPNWSVAAALFAQLNGAKSFTCQIGPSDGCMGRPPECKECNNEDGPSASVIVSSLVNAYNSFRNTYEAIREAGEADGLQMNKFSDVFAPVPDKEGEIIELIVWTSILGGLAGAIPYVGIVAGTAAGLGAGLGMEKFFSNLPSAPDTSSSLGTILNMTRDAVEHMTNELFQNGNFTGTSSDSRSEVALSLQAMMEKDGGTLVNPDGDKKKAYATQRSKFRKILYQQLALVTWQNLQADKVGHIPFIATAPGKCPATNPDAKVDYKEKDQGKNTMKGFEGVDSHIDFEDNCYYLLDGKIYDTWSVSGHSIGCEGVALPGGTKKEFDENSQFFEDLALEDFIIPSVLGWQNHSKQNGYESASANGNLVKDPRDPGVVNIPVCDYLTDYKHPGVGCPVFSARYVDEKTCKTIDKSEGKNEPGQYSQGQCRVHVQQWKKSSNSYNNANQLDIYQISVDIYDSNNRGIGSATKQKADKPLEVANANLPYNLIVVPGGGDDDPMNFWYADQYWDSDKDKDADKPKCHVGKYNDGSHYDGYARQMDCNFDCPLVTPDEEPPKSATIDHPLPNPAVSAYAGPETYLNTYSKPTPAGPNAAEATPDYASGVCSMHVTQYQRNEGAENPTNDFQIEINVKDAKGNQAANLPKMGAPKGKKLTANGLKKPLTVQVGDDTDYGDYSYVYFNYDGFEFTQKTKMKDHKGNDYQVCKYGGYEDGNRDMDCQFNC
ncbi:MAG: hypothetical protein L6R40_002531 [Gallowayella cf. fulva]|nr:MAG: hypothetical protein L6R40_002531 [Xanthomendoza cf. fulva]